MKAVAAGMRGWAGLIIVAGAIVWLLSLAVSLGSSPNGAVVSSDEGAQPVPYWVIL
jgi:hypothetical protein